MTAEPTTELSLGPRDSAVIFRADGTIASAVPHQEDGEISLPSSFAALHAVALFQSPILLKLLRLKLEARRLNYKLRFALKKALT